MVSAQFPIRLEGVEVRRGGQRLLGPLTAELMGGGITIVLGPNGAGKTTFLRMLHGMERVRGRVHWPAAPEVLRSRQAFVFQRPTMMRRSVVGNLAFPLRLSGVGRAEAEAQARAALVEIGLEEKADLDAFNLSGGERQKLALARALIRRPELVFLDEPCASLDGASVREIEAMLTEARASGASAIMATHDLGQAKRLADRVIFLHRGQITEMAEAAAFFEAPHSAEARAFLAGEIVE